MTTRRTFLGGAAVVATAVGGASAFAQVHARRSSGETLFPVDGHKGIVDVHAHVVMPRYIAMLQGMGIKIVPPPTPPPGTDTAEGLALRIAAMDEAGVARHILSPTYAPYSANEADAVAAARFLNDTHAAMINAHPTRLSAFVSLPLPHIDAALGELRRGMDVLGMAGVSLQCFCLDQSIADDQFLPIYRELHRRRGTLFIHPCTNGICSPLVTDWGLSASTGALFEDTTAALQLIIKQVPHKCPDMKIIVPHFGGMLPTLLNRLDNQLKLSIADLPEPPSVTARRFWYDTVGHGSKPALHAAVEAFGAEKIVIGSDFPFLLPYESYTATIDYVRGSNLPPETIGRILHSNTDALFGPEVTAVLA